MATGNAVTLGHEGKIMLIDHPTRKYQLQLFSICTQNGGLNVKIVVGSWDYFIPHLSEQYCLISIKKTSHEYA